MNSILYADNRNPIGFSITATSAKWEPFPVSLAFCCVERQWRGKILELRRVIKTSRAHLRCFDDSTQLEDLTTVLAFCAAGGQWNRKWFLFGGSSSYWKTNWIFWISDYIRTKNYLIKSMGLFVTHKTSFSDMWIIMLKKYCIYCIIQ